MGNDLKIILLSVCVAVVAVVVSIAIFVSNTGSSSLRDFNQKISQMLGEREGPEFVSYSGQYVDGATVRSTIDAVSYTQLRDHYTSLHIVCRLMH